MKINKNLEKIIISRIDSTFEEIQWIPILRPKETTIIGITMDNRWVIKTMYDIVFFNEEKSYIFILPLLEKTLEQITFLLEEQFQTYGVIVKGFDVFPIKEFIMKVFKYQEASSYWIELAFNWFRDFPDNSKKDFIVFLEKIPNNKRFSQKFRHKVRKELFRMRKKA